MVKYKKYHKKNVEYVDKMMKEILDNHNPAVNHFFTQFDCIWGMLKWLVSHHYYTIQI
jgi:hypothetical protein